MKNTSITASFADASHMTMNPNMKPAKPSAKKAAMAKDILEKYVVPNQAVSPKKRKPKNGLPPLTDLQKELLQVYVLQPNEQQMTELKAFLARLFSKTIPSQTIVAEQDLEIAA